MADSKEYLIQGHEDGTILISDEVICTIAAAAVMEVEGVVSLNTNIGSDLAEMLGVKMLGKGIKPGNLGTKPTFADIAATVTDLLGVHWDGAGTSFAREIL